MMLAAKEEDFGGGQRKAHLHSGTLVEYLGDGAVAIEACEIGWGAATQVRQAVHHAILKQQPHHLQSTRRAAQPIIWRHRMSAWLTAMMAAI
jgi:hypothetical protein